jgi:hypothetical protein
MTIGARVTPRIFTISAEELAAHAAAVAGLGAKAIWREYAGA